MRMVHTIARMTHAKTDEWLDFGQREDKFWVRYSAKIGDERVEEKEFDTAAAAAQVYTKLAGWILLGAYSEDARIQFLKTGTME